jgi:lipopolysaccharide transport system permease protein
MITASETQAQSPVAQKEPTKTIVIKASHGWVSLKLGELWEYRELLYFLVWRDIKVRYKQTLLGASWAILQPLTTMVVFSFFFGRLAQVPSDGIPYPIFSYTALVPWTFFAAGLSQSSNSLVSSSGMIKKIYFPRLVVPISGVLVGLPDFLLSYVVLFGMMVYYGIYPTWGLLLLLPLFLLLAGITSLGVGLWLSALNVRYRDIRYIVPFISQLWMFVTPIAYSSTILDRLNQINSRQLLHSLTTMNLSAYAQVMTNGLKDVVGFVYGLNPMVGVVDGFRWVLLGRGTPPNPIIFVSAVAAVVILITGALYFRRMEKTFADIV